MFTSIIITAKIFQRHDFFYRYFILILAMHWFTLNCFKFEIILIENSHLLSTCKIDRGSLSENLVRRF